MGNIVEFFGMSRAGKTTQLQLLTDALVRSGHSFVVVDRSHINMPEKINIENWHGQVFNKLNYVMTEYMNSQKDYLLFDRGFYDRLVLLIADYNDRYIGVKLKTNLERKIIKQIKNIDYVFFFDLSPYQSLERWSNQKESGLDKSSMKCMEITRDNFDGLNDLNEIYRTIAMEFASEINDIDGVAPRKETHEYILKVLDLDCSSY